MSEQEMRDLISALAQVGQDYDRKSASFFSSFFHSNQAAATNLMDLEKINIGANDLSYSENKLMGSILTIYESLEGKSSNLLPKIKQCLIDKLNLTESKSDDIKSLLKQRMESSGKNYTISGGSK